MFLRLQHYPPTLRMQCEQLFLTAAKDSMCGQENIPPPATVCQEFCLIFTITAHYSEVAGCATELLSYEI